MEDAGGPAEVETGAGSANPMSSTPTMAPPTESTCSGAVAGAKAVEVLVCADLALLPRPLALRISLSPLLVEGLDVVTAGTVEAPPAADAVTDVTTA